MKKIIFLMFLFSAIFITGHSSAGVWQDATLNIKAREFFALAESRGRDKVVYVGTSEGLYAKSPKDAEWNQIFLCRGSYRGINHIHVDDEGAIYIATKNGLYKTHDSGETWKRLFRGIDRENDCSSIVSDQRDSKILFLATGKGLFWTKDGGKTWKRPRGIIGNCQTGPIALDGDNVFVIAGNELYKGDKNFKSYEKIFASTDRKNTEENAGEHSEEETESENGTLFYLNYIIARQNTLYLSTSMGLFLSKNKEASWTRFNDAGLSSRCINYTLVLGAGPDAIFAGTKKGVFRYDTGSEEWKQIYAGMESIDVKKLMISPDHRYIWALCKNRVYKMGLSDLSGIPPEGLETDGIFLKFEDEPTINEAQAMAIDYAEVYPDKIARWRKAAKFKALLPKINFKIDRSQSDTYEIYTSSSTYYWLYGPADKTDGWGVNLSWDLSDLVWNESQTNIDIRSKLMVQLRDDIVDEVTRTYFERRRLQIELLMNPPNTLHAKLKKILRIQELTASLDGLTGGAFSRAITSA